MSKHEKKYRVYGYDILINNFEPLIRDYLIDKVLIPHYGNERWVDVIPQGVINVLKEEGKLLKFDQIHIFFDELYLWCLKEIIIQKQIFPLLSDLFGNDLSKETFISIFDDLNEQRRKIAHSKSNYSSYDYEFLKEKLILLCKGDASKSFINYIERSQFDSIIPDNFFKVDDINNNLPVEEYDLDGGFVGRKKEIETIKKLLFSNQDRIVSITGAGGLGKTAIALKCAYSILANNENLYTNIIWLSAKINKLTADDGIVTIDSQISSYFKMLQDILSIIDESTFGVYIEMNINEDNYKDAIYKHFTNNRSLLIIDNLETITDTSIIDFIKNVPRPSQVLITSRKGLRELERRYPLPDFKTDDAVTLFRIISKEKSRQDLLKLQQCNIENLVKKVRSYPLLIKWSIGKICLGMDINEAFSEINSGDSEISIFVFNDIFELLSSESKKCLYSMVVFGDKPISKHMIQHLSGFNNDTLDDSLQELIISSFIYQEALEEDDKISTHFLMLSLTRGFVQNKLDNDISILRELQTKYYELNYQLEQTEKSKLAFYDSLAGFGITTEEDKIAFNYVKTAKNYLIGNNYESARENFDKAYSIAPKLSYVLIEYGKFESMLGHSEKAESFFCKACDVDEENYHAFFSYGIFLRKHNRIDESIKTLEKANKINSEYLPIYNELGRAYSFSGQYEKANNLFDKAKSQRTEFINYKHLNITLHYQSDNYKRWSEDFFQRKDFKNGLSTLYKSLDTIKKANENDALDKKNILLEKQICLNIGLSLLKGGNYEEGKSFMLEAANFVYSVDKSYVINSNISCQCYYYLASYSKKLMPELKEKQIEYISKADELCSDERIRIKIDRLKDQILGNNILSGKIKRVDLDKKFGIIDGPDNKSYTFIFRNMKSFFYKNQLSSLVGKNVTFIILENSEGKNFATSVVIND